MSTVKLTKWGNSIGIRIPSAIIKEAHWVPGTALTIIANNKGGVTLTPVQQQADWTAMFNAIADADQNESLLNVDNAFDDEEWTW